MASKIRLIVSIVISAVLLGLVVVFCIKTWMPAEAFDWVMLITMAVLGVFAIYRIANLAKTLDAEIRKKG